MDFNKTVCACASSEKSETLERTIPGGTPLICSLLAGFPAFTAGLPEGRGSVSPRARTGAHPGQEQGEASIVPPPRPPQVSSSLPHPFPSPLLSHPTNFSGY